MKKANDDPAVVFDTAWKIPGSPERLITDQARECQSDALRAYLRWETR
ncbi:hypothetical protein NP284_08610 [Rhodopseudomonas pseudopalustris]